MVGGAGGSPDVSTMRDCVVSILQFGDAVKLYNTYIYTIMAKQIRLEKGGAGGDAAEAMRDMLSEFFGTVSEQCQKAFALIRQVRTQAARQPARPDSTEAQRGRRWL